MTNVMLSLIAQRLKSKIAHDMSRIRTYVEHELVGRTAVIYWNDPLDRESAPLKIEGTIATAGFDAERNITVTISFTHPHTSASITVPRYLSELR